ncbi:MAG: hypothetical protein BroJett004_07910 [Planctomycetota bacterium]|nr:MAG: hypothetical protein BroJett004_07910 [Planctomycetota bacterium]
MDERDYIPSLNEATFAQLIDELGRRCACVIVCASRDVPGDAGSEGVSTWYRGGWAAAIGLAEYARADLRRRLFSPTRVEIGPEGSGGSD